MQDRLLTVKEVAGYFWVSTATIQRWCRAGKLPAVRLGHEWRVDGVRLQAMVRQGGELFQHVGRVQSHEQQQAVGPFVPLFE